MTDMGVLVVILKFFGTKSHSKTTYYVNFLTIMYIFNCIAMNQQMGPAATRGG